MQLCHTVSRSSAVFDEPTLVSAAGLVPVPALAERAGLGRLADGRLTVPTDKGAPTTRGKSRSRSTAEATEARVANFCRPIWTHADDFTLMPPFGGPTRQGLDVDDTIRATDGYAKQGAGYGSGRPRAATVCGPPRSSPSRRRRCRTGAHTFRGGQVKVEVDASYVSDDLAVLAVVERQRGLVGDLTEQDWSLRVTLPLRLEGGQWRLVHRYADALVHPIGWNTVSQLARGELAD